MRGWSTKRLVQLRPEQDTQRTLTLFSLNLRYTRLSGFHKRALDNVVCRLAMPSFLQTTTVQ